MAERAFAGRPDLEVTSAGLASDAEEVATPETLERAELIFVMEKVHRARLRRRFGPQMPEMWKTRPVVVVSYRNRLNWPCLVVPISTVPQDANPWAHKVGELIEGVQGWAICNQPSTVAPSRFSTFGGKVPRMSDADFDAILAKLLIWLPKLPAAAAQPPLEN